MKKYLFLAAIALTSCKAVWNAPAIESSENNAPRVVSVSFRDTVTVVEMEKTIGYGIRIDGSSKLVSDRMKASTLRWVDGMPKVNGLHSTATVRFRLGFDPVGKGVKRLDFAEGAGEKDYRIWGIRPKGKRLTGYEYKPVRTPIEGEGLTLLKEILKHHKDKAVMLQLVDMESDESIAVLRRSEAVRKMYADDQRVSFVFLARPDSKEYEERARSAIVVGTAAFMEYVSPDEYDRLLALLLPYMPEDRVLCLDQDMQMLQPGLLYFSPELFGRQLDLMFGK